jgi:hypothetical protein
VNICAPNSPLALLQSDLDAFAPYEDRYTSKTYTRAQLWKAYRLAQFATAEVLRSITERNLLAVVVRSPIFIDSAPAAQSPI